MVIDWLAASVDERRALYRVVKRLLDEEGLSWNQLYDDALGREFRPGHGYEDNFRAGRISRKVAHRIHAWLRGQHPAHAMRLDRMLGVAVSGEAHTWDRFLEKHGEYGRLSVVPLPDPALTIVAFATLKPKPEATLRLGEPFCFMLDSPIAGTALALQSIGTDWHSLPLSEDALTVPVVSGRQFLPRLPGTDSPLPLAEQTHLGPHGFLILIGAPVVHEIAARFHGGGAISIDALNRLARLTTATMGEWTAQRLDVTFTP